MAGASGRGYGEDGNTPGPATGSIADPGVDGFIDCSGATPAVRSGFTAVRSEGTLVLVGMRVDEIALPISLHQPRELNMTGVFRYTATWPVAAHLAATGQDAPASLVTAGSNSTTRRKR